MDRFPKKPASELKGVGAYYKKRLERLGIKTIGDLLWHFPHRYEDFSKVEKIQELQVGDICSIIGKVQTIKNRRAWRRRMFLTEAIVSDDTASIFVIWFGQPYLTRNIPKDSIVSLAGKVQLGDEGLYFSNPAYEVINRGTTRKYMAAEQRGKILRSSASSSASFRDLKHTAGLIPVYPETQGLTSRALRFLIKPLIPEAQRMPEVFPASLLKRLNLLSFGRAISEVHFPTSLELAKAAKKRFAFEELLLLQLFLLSNKKRVRSLRSPVISIDLPLVKNFIASLPFELTQSQKQAAWQILKDLAKPHPMNRLLNGDVGSGKTIVATIASLEVLSQKFQVAFLAPTEILARQHFETINRLLEPFPISTALLVAKDTQMTSEGLRGKISRRTLLEKLKNNAPFLVIGTHALIQKGVHFGNLGLVIVDEQHRFGVSQRARLTRGTTPADTQNDADNVLRESALSPRKSAFMVPHLLTMTATPIPRTLALSLYGDLDISILDEMPSGRKHSISKVIPPARRKGVYKFIRDQVKGGRQTFIICPRIELPEDKVTSYAQYLTLDTRAVKTEHEHLSKKIFPDLNLGLLHGKLKSNQKEAVMTKFAANEIPILVSTSVVEVGIDIPNATVMMIEGAENFGLAQLHQFRGRVGRGEHQSYCFLLSSSPGKAAIKRLEAFASLNDGFKLAEEDLKIRGPGEFFGTQQSGLPDLAMQALKDLPLLQLARTEALALFEKDQELSSLPLLRQRLQEFRQEVHLE